MTGAREPGTPGPHQGQPVLHAGADLVGAAGAMVLVHGRGASAADILTLAAALGRSDVAYLAPEAHGGTWYPKSFLAPIADNEPGITSGLQAIADVLTTLADAGIAPNRTVIGGFSQGACLAAEFAARHPRRYGGVVALSGGLIGPPGASRDYAGSLDGTPVFLGCSDIDPHIPAERVRETEEVFRRMHGVVTARLYRGMGHLVNEDELVRVHEIVAGATASD